MVRKLMPAALLVAALPAHADRLPLPADTPPAFVNECGSCHLAFPPSLLNAADWQHVMANLGDHYGDDASLDDRTRREIDNFLARNAGSGKRTVGARPGGVPPRLTFTGWFVRKHDEVPSRLWRDARVGSAANCATCHPGAEAGSFSERELRMPRGYRHERD